ncbi:MAG: CHAT domain-containing protein [Bacteroidia bacterium]|nr:CHAT domain-containing protein [Bacteroidia bacterium]
MTVPAVLLAAANPLDHSVQLPGLVQEQQALLDHFSGKIEVLSLPLATLPGIVARFNDHPGRIRIFHFAGHANGRSILLEPDASGNTSGLAQGLAAYIGQQQSVSLVFLNGCATRDQIKLFMDSGIPAVIATTRPIQDDIARQFATDFYGSFCAGKNIQTAFDEATSLLHTRHADPRQIYTRDLGLDEQPETASSPYELHLSSTGAGNVRLEDWKEPEKPAGTIQQANNIYNIGHIDNANFS